MKHTIFVQCDNVLLRPLLENDIEDLRLWRNDVSFTKFLKPLPYITPEMQKNWYESDLADTDSYTFAVQDLELNRFAGSVSLYNFRNDVAECGHVMIDKTLSGRGLGFKTMLLSLYIGFNILSLRAIDGFVHENNESAKRMDLKVGFEIVGERPFDAGGIEHKLFITKERFISVNPFANEIEVLKKCE